MGKAVKSFILLVLLALGWLVYAAFALVDDSPEIPWPGETDLSQARVFIENRDPRRLQPGELAAFTVDAQDFSRLIDYALGQWRGGASLVALREGEADIRISVALPDTLLGNYLNLHLEVSQLANQLAVESLRVGNLRMPGALADRLLWFAHRRLLARFPEYQAAMDAINGFSIDDNRVNVVYQWQPALVEQLSSRGRDLLVSKEDQERLLAHARRLSEITNQSDLPRNASLTRLLGPMFQFAHERGGDPVAENRAALAAMAMYVLGVNAPRVLGLPADAVPPPGRHHFTLTRRRDFAQHFLISAGLTAGAGTGLADSIGLLKELDDVESGSGFSFNDLGADRTGVRFAELAVADPDSARALQEKLQAGVEEALFMPDFSDLAEFLPPEAFAELYGEVGSPAYRAVLDDIEARIDAMPLFLDPGR